MKLKSTVHLTVFYKFSNLTMNFLNGQIIKYASMQFMKMASGHQTRYWLMKQKVGA